MRVKTTLELERPLYLALKKKAAEENKTLKKIMDEIIIAWMNREKKAPHTPADSKDIFPRRRGLGARFDLDDGTQLKKILHDQELSDFLDRR